MAVTKIVAFDADDNKVDIYTTDDPAEGGGSALQDIVDALGDEEVSGDEADSTEEAALSERLAALTDALRSGQDDDALRVAVAEDILSGQLSVSVDGQSGSFTVTDDGSFDLSANDGTDIGDVGIEDISPVTGQSAQSDSIPVTLASDEDAVGVKDSDGTDIDPAKNLNGASAIASVTDTSNATIQVPDGRTVVTVMVGASGGAVDMTVEVSTDGNNWYEETDVFAANVADGDTEAETFQTGAEYVRASGDANVGRVEVAAKGA